MEQRFEDLSDEEIVAPENQALLNYIRGLVTARRSNAESVVASALSTSDLLRKLGARTITLFLNPGSTYIENLSKDSTAIAARILITGELPNTVTDDVRNGVNGVARDFYRWMRELQYRSSGRITDEVYTDSEPASNMSLYFRNNVDGSNVTIGTLNHRIGDSQPGIEVLLYQPSINTPYGIAAIINDPTSFEGWLQRFGTVQQAPENPQIQKVDLQ